MKIKKKIKTKNLFESNSLNILFSQEMNSFYLETLTIA
jgi:hypothetical protein